MKQKRNKNGRFKKHYYNLPKSWNVKLAKVLPFIYAGIIACYPIYCEAGTEFYRNFQQWGKYEIYPREELKNWKVEKLETEKLEDVEPEEEPKLESVEDIIRRVAEEENFQEVETLVKIAKCESNLKLECGELNHPSCVNPTNNSYDRGIFQISRKWHPEVDDVQAFDFESATKEAIRIQRRAGWEAWACWNIIK